MSKRNPWTRENATAQLDGAAFLNWYKTVDRDGNGCSSSPGDYFMSDPNKPLSMRLLRKIAADVRLPRDHVVVAYGWVTISHKVTRAKLQELRDNGAYFEGDTLTY